MVVFVAIYSGVLLSAELYFANQIVFRYIADDANPNVASLIASAVLFAPATALLTTVASGPIVGHFSSSLSASPAYAYSSALMLAGTAYACQRALFISLAHFGVVFPHCWVILSSGITLSLLAVVKQISTRRRNRAHPIDVHPKTASPTGSQGDSGGVRAAEPAQSYVIGICLGALLLVLSISLAVMSWNACPSCRMVSPNTPPETIAGKRFTVLARMESTTGLVSVVEDNLLKMRVMRCGRSILGGVHKGEGIVGESVFSAFHIQEAVRLVRTDCDDSAEGRRPKRSLHIGLGVGTAAAAFVKLGLDVDVVEIDGAIADMAQRYFEFPCTLR
eukprot:Opistho-2@84175